MNLHSEKNNDLHLVRQTHKQIEPHNEKWKKITIILLYIIGENATK